MKKLSDLLSLNKKAIGFVQVSNFKKAFKIYQKADSLFPKNPYVLKNLANTERILGKTEDAIKHYQDSLSIKADAETLADLGYTYLGSGQGKSAQSCFKKSLELIPEFPPALYGLGHVANLNGDTKAAAEFYGEIFNISPGYEMSASNFYISKRKICDWEDLDKVDDYLQKTHKETPWASVVRTEDEEQNLIAGALRSMQYKKNATKSGFTFKNDRDKKPNKIKIGYVSGNFGNHAVSYTMASIFEYHNKKDFEIFAYSYGKNDNSKVRKNIEKSVDHFTDLNGLNNLEAAQKINADDVDILVDLTGYTEGTRSEIFAYKPCPIQVTWAGLSASTGSDFFDYMFVDDIVVPKKSQKHYAEKLIYLSPCFCPFKIVEAKDFDFTRKDFGLPKDAFVFGCFNQTYKIEKTSFDIWIDILKSSPRSVLWMLSQNEDAKNNLLKYAKEKGVKEDRIIFAEQTPTEMFVSRMKLADAALDTFIYGGGTTTYLTLQNEVPVVTMLGKHPASRFSASVLDAANAKDLIAKNKKQYKQIAVNLATNKTFYENIKNKISAKRLIQNIFDTKSKTQEIESAYKEVWKNYLKGNSPVTISQSHNN